MIFNRGEPAYLIIIVIELIDMSVYSVSLYYGDWALTKRGQMMGGGGGGGGGGGTMGGGGIGVGPDSLLHLVCQ